MTITENMDEFVQKTIISWPQRMAGAIAGLIFAPIFVFAGFFALKHGEIKHAKTTNALNVVIHEVESPEEARVGEVFRYVGTVYSPGERYRDEQFNLEIDAIKVYRQVYSYQWFERESERKKRTANGEETTEKTYTYSKKWSRTLINSDRFKIREGHENPKTRAAEPQLFEQEEILMGQYILHEKFRKALLNYRLLPLRQDMFSSVEYMILDTLNTAICPGDQLKTDISKASYGGSRTKTSSLYLGNGMPDNPQIGDTRIEYWYLPTEVYTVVGEKSRNMIIPQSNSDLFIHSELPCGGVRHSPYGDFGMLFSGDQTVKEMFQIVHRSNDKMFVLLRFIGLVFVVAGFAIFGNPLRLLFGWIPFLGAIWEKIVFKIMQVLGTMVSIGISVYYFLNYNSISNLTIYDLYFVFAVILFLFFINGLSVSVRANGGEVFAEDF